MALIRGVVCAVFEKILKVLSAKLNKLLGLLPDHLFDEVLENAGEGIGHFDLLGSENSHLAHV